MIKLITLSLIFALVGCVADNSNPTDPTDPITARGPTSTTLAPSVPTPAPVIGAPCVVGHYVETVTFTGGDCPVGPDGTSAQLAPFTIYDDGTVTFDSGPANPGIAVSTDTSCNLWWQRVGPLPGAVTSHFGFDYSGGETTFFHDDGSTCVGTFTFVGTVTPL